MGAYREVAAWMDKDAAEVIDSLNQQPEYTEAATEAFSIDPARIQRMEQAIFNRIEADRRSEPKLAPEQHLPAANPIHWLFRVAAVVLLAVGMGYFVFRPRGFSQKVSPRFITQVTGPGQRATLQLPDGSLIRMSTNSRVSYPVNFAHQPQREIRLQGEAFFEVAKNPKKPFVVTTRQATIRVLGTSFNVKETLHDTTVIVAVREGRVAFRSRRDSLQQQTELRKGEIGSLHGSSLTRSGTHDITNYLSWYNGRLVFEDAPLPEVVQQLTRIYDTPIQLDNPELAHLRLTADMKRETLTQVLDQLALSLNIRYQQQRKTVMLFSK
jgi:ferric-dicitrate binding protein FerR (iron transport regulator)